MTSSERPLGSRYRLRERLGAGATGEVWRAVDADGEQVAVKLLHPWLAQDDDVVTRFLGERRVLTRLNHPRLVGLRDLVAEGDQLGIVMDLVDGPDLRTVLARRATLRPGEVAHVGAELAAALAEIHAHGIHHRDIKPENVMATSCDDDPVGHVVLTDFGIARIAGESPRMTTAVVGTPSYMAPELVDGRPPTAASDLYALGCVLFELSVGVPPFAGATPMAVLHQHATVVPQRPEGMPQPLWSVVERLLAKDPTARPHDAATVAAELDAVVPLVAGMPAAPRLTSAPAWPSVDYSGTQQVAPAAVRPLRTQPTITPAPVGGPAVVASPVRRTPRWVLPAAAVALLATAGGTALALSRGGSSTPPVATVTTTLTASAVAPTSAPAPTSASSGPASTSAPVPTVTTAVPATSTAVPAPAPAPRTVTVTATTTAASSQDPMAGEGLPPEGELPDVISGSGYVVVLNSSAKSSTTLDAARARAARIGPGLLVVDSSATTGMRAGFWAVTAPQVYATSQEALAQCPRWGRTKGGGCYARRVS